MMSNNAGPTKMAGFFYDSKIYTTKTEELSKSTWMRSLSVSIIADCKVRIPHHPISGKKTDGFGISDLVGTCFLKKSFL